eukprot:CAMPEP_0116154818 /NCGR_PEP_ID=MMETSP0329-20121206/21983_1 /TAXON_ID=697910 /ORGANISM="Pseudo-nitzschia arenysensis, Strain B593" /LENGTH=354 /DNA_ID=CAMNT_0003651823 /DNA_START=57 /DNA_END=1117 /DNA_ORIENTATION=-
MRHDIKPSGKSSSSMGTFCVVVVWGSIIGFLLGQNFQRSIQVGDYLGTREMVEDAPTARKGSPSRMSLDEITRNPPPDSIQCPPMTSPIYDRIIPATKSTSNIPKIIHVTHKSRCIETEMFAANVKKWKETLPDWSFYFHDDHAVDRLINLRNMNCVKYKGAMKIDVWRMLLSYEFGGLYTDTDNTPPKEFKNGTIIDPEDTFWSTQDSNSRPLHNTFAMEPKHPAAYFTLEQILQNIFQMQSMRWPSLIHVTGPDVFSSTVWKYLLITEPNLKRMKPRVYHDFLGKKLHHTKEMSFAVENKKDMTVLDGYKLPLWWKKANAISGSTHWDESRRINRHGKDYTCREYLYRLEHG